MNRQTRTRVSSTVAMLTLGAWQASVLAQDGAAVRIDAAGRLYDQLVAASTDQPVDVDASEALFRAGLQRRFSDSLTVLPAVTYGSDGCSVGPMVPNLFLLPGGSADATGMRLGDDGVLVWEPGQNPPMRFGVPLNPGFIDQSRVLMPNLAPDGLEAVTSGAGPSFDWSSPYLIDTLFNPANPSINGTMDPEGAPTEGLNSANDGILPPVGADDDDADDSAATNAAAADGSEAPPEPQLPPVPLYIKATNQVLQADGSTSASPFAGAQVKTLFPPGVLPLAGEDKDQQDFDADPVQGTTDDDGVFALLLNRSLDDMLPDDTGDDTPPDSDTPEDPADQLLDVLLRRGIQFDLPASEYGSVIFQGAPGSSMDDLIDVFPADWLNLYMHQGQIINNSPFLTITWPGSVAGEIELQLAEIAGSAAVTMEENYCRAKQLPNDPSFVQAASRGRVGSWGQPYDDQWAIKRVGLTGEPESAWNLLGDDPASVNVAVIDTGLDWNHLDISWDNIWKNPAEVPSNGIDDDGNGYVDDIIGWDVLTNNNLPWDYDGHGTVVAGIIAAEQDNGVGIAGINPYAKLMVLKALNEFGNSRASYIAESIVYAVDQGARVINISVGGDKISTIEREAVDYANEMGVLIVAAAGNEGRTLDDYGPSGLPGVVTVAATDQDDLRTIFSNWGQQVDLAAPGIDVMSLRARRTDTMRDIPDVEYLAGGAYVGDDNRYYRASGTSFAAPIVSGIASLVLSKDPDISHAELHRILTQSATDTEIPGKDQFTGFGIVNAAAALSLDRNYFIDSLIASASVVEQDGEFWLAVSGTANASDFGRARVEIGAGEAPESFRSVGETISDPVIDGQLVLIPAAEFGGSTQWVLRLITAHDDGTEREAWFLLSLG